MESLADAPRIVRNLLSEQRIRCDHHERGCQEIVQLGNLASHVAVCGKAPVVCANEECSSEINRENQVRHENEECRFREVKCRNCKEMASMVQEIGTSFGGLSEHVEKLSTSVNEQLTEVKTGSTAMENRLETRFGEMENKFEKKFEEMQARFEKVENQFLNAKDLTIRDEQHKALSDDRESARSDQATAVDPSSDFKDIKIPNAFVVAGGYGKEGEPLDSVEILTNPVIRGYSCNQ